MGRVAAGGITRLAYTDAGLEARAWFEGQAHAAGLEVSVDSAGNILALEPSGGNHYLPVLSGSHLDTVPQGGCYYGHWGWSPPCRQYAPSVSTPMSLPGSHSGSCFSPARNRAVLGWLSPKPDDSERRGWARIRRSGGFTGPDGPGRCMPGWAWLGPRPIRSGHPVGSMSLSSSILIRPTRYRKRAFHPVWLRPSLRPLISGCGPRAGERIRAQRECLNGVMP